MPKIEIVSAYDFETRAGERMFGSVETAKLQAAVKDFTASMHGILSDIKEVGGYELAEVTLTAEVSAKGGLSLLGSGVEVGGKGGLTFRFVRPTGD